MGGLGILYFDKQTEWNRIVGERISQRRAERGLSLRNLGILAEVSIRSLSRYERGLTCPESHTLYRIARSLNVDIGYFYGSIRAAEHATF